MQKEKQKEYTPSVSTITSKKKLWMNWDDLKRAGLIPMLIVVVTLSFAVKFYVGHLALGTFSLARWQGIGIVVCVFLLVTFFLDILASLTELKNFKDHESGKINIVALWKKVFTNPLNGILLITVMTFGITSAQSLSDYYRDNVTTWYDAHLWALEASFFYLLKGSLIDFPIFWDKVYFAFWNYLIFVYCILYRLQKFYDLAIISITTVFCFFLTRWIALQYPTAGPVFFEPDLFHLSGTASGNAQKYLALYMEGGLTQNGFIPGTMGMPSLHIGITTVAAWFLSRNVRWTIWLNGLFFCLVWLSTIMLGWHYVLDGVGGIAVALVCVLGTRRMLSVISFY
jgi:hypothetical protein